MSRLKKQWEDEHTEWRQRDLTNRRYVYWWADGIYSNVRMDDRLCLLVIIGVTEHGRKELVAVEDGFRESAASWETAADGPARARPDHGSQAGGRRRCHGVLGGIEQDLPGN